MATKDTSVRSTPFSQWQEEGKDDPHGEHYSQDINTILCGDIPSVAIADSLLTFTTSMSRIAALSAGKERLRWLSRKLYSLTDNHNSINEERAMLLCGDMTDDALANAFFLSEEKADLEAGRERIIWLHGKIQALTAKNNVKDVL